MPLFHRGDELLGELYGLAEPGLFAFGQQQGLGLPQLRKGLVVFSQADRDGGHIAELRLAEGVAREAVVQHGLAGGVSDLAAFAAHGHGNELEAIPLGGGGETVSGSGGEPGFQACGPGVKPYQLIGVGQTEGPIPHGIHPDGGEMGDVRMASQKLPGHEGDVVGAGAVARGIGPVVQTGAVDKVGVVHSQLPGPCVHPVHKGRLTAGQVLRHGTGAVIGGGDGNGFEHFRDGHLLSGLQKDLAAALCGCCLRGGDGILIAQGTGVNGLHNEQHGHDLGDAGGGQGLMGILFVKHRAGGHVHQYGAFGVYLQAFRPGPWGGGQCQKNGANKRQQSFHPHSLHPQLCNSLWGKPIMYSYNSITKLV